MNVGLLYTPVSIFQMTRGALVLFVGILSVIFLHRRLHLYQWLALLIVMGGVGVVGLSGSLVKKALHEDHPSQLDMDDGPPPETSVLIGASFSLPSPPSFPSFLFSRRLVSLRCVSVSFDPAPAGWLFLFEEAPRTSPRLRTHDVCGNTECIPPIDIYGEADADACCGHPGAPRRSAALRCISSLGDQHRRRLSPVRGWAARSSFRWLAGSLVCFPFWALLCARGTQPQPKADLISNLSYPVTPQAYSSFSSPKSCTSHLLTYRPLRTDPLAC
jgi:hypothetical protein